LAGGLTLGIRSFLPNLTFWRGFTAFCGAVGLPPLLVLFAMFGISAPLLFVLTLEVMCIALGFRTGALPSKAERKRQKIEA
jgi:hypothetical protein